VDGGTTQAKRHLLRDPIEYRIANEILERYLAKRKSTEARRESLETLTQAELRSLEEPITADAEGEVVLVEDLDDIEYHQRDFVPPAHYQSDPLAELEREEEALQILQALSRLQERERVVFELFVIEGFSKEAVAKIYHIPPDEVPRMADKVKAQVLREIKTEPGEKEEKAEKGEKAS